MGEILKFRRSDSFRYEFEETISCNLKIISINGTPYESDFITGTLIDVSPNGFKLYTTFDIPINKDVIVFVEFTINNQPLTFSATLVWKRDVGNGYHYGLKHHGNKEDVSLLVETLKTYAKEYTMKKKLKG